jgi:hypothetical protein
MKRDSHYRTAEEILDIVESSENPPTILDIPTPDY